MKERILLSNTSRKM